MFKSGQAVRIRTMIGPFQCVRKGRMDADFTKDDGAVTVTLKREYFPLVTPIETKGEPKGFE